jgi:hypothetical protein
MSRLQSWFPNPASGGEPATAAGVQEEYSWHELWGGQSSASLFWLHQDGAWSDWDYIQAFDPAVGRQVRLQGDFLRMNERLELIFGQGQWFDGRLSGGAQLVRDGRVHDLNPLVPAGWWVDATVDLNKTGTILAWATPTVDANGATIDEENWASEPVLLVPIEVTWVSANAGGALSDNRVPVATNLYGKEVVADTWMEGKGKRVFPDALTYDAPAHNTVTLRVHVGPAAAGMQVHVRALDVDDPTPDGFDEDGIGNIEPYAGSGGKDVFGRDMIHDNHRIIDPYDYYAEDSGDDNLDDPLGTPLTGAFANGTDRASATVNALGNADFVFTVGMQPGNNYRVAVVVDAPATNLNALQVDDFAGASYVPADSDKQVPATEFAGALSPLLTVWRKLHVEQDSMLGPPSDPNDLQRNFEFGNIVTITPSATVAGHYSLTSNVPLPGGHNRFEGGLIYFAGRHYEVVSNSHIYFVAQGDAPVHIGDTVTIKDDPDPAHSIAGLGSLVGLPFGIVDDDERYLDPGVNDLPRTDLVTDAVKGKFVPAYIEVDTVVINATVSVPFILNVPATYSSLLNKNVPASNAYWACRVIAAFQQVIGGDGDPYSEGLVDGGTSHGDSYIFLETIREPFQEGLNVTHPNNSYDVNRRVEALNQLPIRREEVVAHEIGHNPKNDLTHNIDGGLVSITPDHAEGGLMGEGAVAINASDTVRQNLSALTIYRFRKAKKWDDK